MQLLPGVTARTVPTERLDVHVYESGPEDGVPVVLVQGNLSTGRFYEHLMSGAPSRYRLLAPDMRGFGRTQRLPIDATRGLGDWADDVHALVRALGIERSVHLAGWSTGGAAVATYAQDRPVASLTLIDPVSPYGFGGVHEAGTPCYPDFAGSGGGTGNPAFAATIAAGDRTADTPLSPRSVMRSSYWSPSFTVDGEREDVLVDEVLLSEIGDDGYPGDATSSANWPGTAPGTRGILNALSPKYCNWSGLVDVDPKPPVLWTHGTADVVIADGSPRGGRPRARVARRRGVPTAADDDADPDRARSLPRRRRLGAGGAVRRLGPRAADRRLAAVGRVVLRPPRRR